MSSAKKASNDLYIGHLNACGLKSKITDLTVFLDEPNAFDIFGVTESRLKSENDDVVVNIPNYSIFRRDPKFPLETGVAVYIHDSIKHAVRRRNDLETQDVEGIWLEVKTTKASPVLVGIIYRNPAARFEWYDSFVHMFDKIKSKHSDVILLGDFNRDVYKSFPAWETTLTFLGLEQMITSPTRVTSTTATLIDHIYTTNKNRIVATHVPQVAISDHYPICCHWSSKADKLDRKRQHTSIHFRSMKHFQTDAFLADVYAASFDSVFGFSDPNDALKEWYKIFLPILDKHAPLREKRVKNLSKPKWLNKEIIEAMELRDNLKREKDAKAFRKQRNHVKCLVRKAQKEHFQKLMDDKKDIVSVWRALNAFTKPQKKPICTTISADSFNKHFLSIASKVLSQNMSSSSPSVSTKLKDFCQKRISPSKTFQIPPMSVFDVARSISQLEPKRSFGHDGISSFFLKLATPYIAESLAYIYNLCILNGTFPEDWKIAKVTPIPKSKDLDDPGNFRPISLLPTLSKPIEKHVSKHLNSFLEKHSLLYPLQSGFREKHSCHTALTHLTDKLLSSINDGKMTGALFLDFSKAFDLVNHNNLIAKLSHYQLSADSVSFFTSYLQNRSQYVFINGKCSNTGLIEHGVPQGSILGPLLFSIYINDMPLEISDPSVNCSLFADDGTIDTSSENEDTINEKLQTSLNEVSQWCSSNFMVLNPGKTKCMLMSSRQKLQRNPSPLQLTLNGQPITQVPQHRLLGVTIDEQLSWHPHVDNICKKLSKNLHLLSKINSFMDVSARKLFYAAHIKPHLDFASTLWDGCSAACFKRINRLHRRAVKLISDDKESSTDDRMLALNFLPLKKSLLLNKGALMWKTLNNKTPSYLTILFRRTQRVRRSARNAASLVVPWPRVDMFKSSLSYSGAKLWNSLPDDITSAPSLCTFKARMHKYLMKSK